MSDVDREKLAELAQFARALKEVEANLDTIYERSRGLTYILWGFVGAAIFAFYQLVGWNPDPYELLLGEMLPWVWTVGVGIGYLGTFALGLRTVRLTRGKDAAPDLWLMLSIIGAFGMVTALLVVNHQELRIPSAWVFAIGLILLARGGSTPWVVRARRALAAVAFLGGAVLLASAPDHGWLVAGAYFAVGFVTVGVLQYRAL